MGTKNKIQIREEILEFVEEKLRNNTYPTRDEITKKFKIGLRHYFRNMEHLYDLIHDRRHVIVHPSKLSKKFSKDLIRNYIKEQILNGYYPSRNQIERHFKIDIRSVFYYSTRAKLPLESFYGKLGFSPLYGKQAKHASLSNARPKSFVFNSISEGRNKIINFIYDEFRKDKIPTRYDIQNEFCINLSTYFTSLKEAYGLANVPYTRPELGIIFLKEKKLTKIAKLIFSKMGYKIIRVSIESRINRNRGPDMVVKDKNDNPLLIELKAYHRNHCIGAGEINQVTNYMIKLKINRCILMTTANKIDSGIDLPENVKIVLSKDLIILLRELNLGKFIPEVNWIRSSFATNSKKSFAKNIKNKIITFIKQEIEEGRFPHRKKIEKKFNVHLETYFDCHSVYDVLKTLHLQPPLKFKNPREKKDIIINYIREIFQKEKVLPTRNELEKMFRVSLITYFGRKNTIMKTYEAANVPVPLRFIPKEETINQIVEYVRNKLDNNEIVLKKEIQSQFKICPEGLIRKQFMKKIIKLAKCPTLG